MELTLEKDGAIGSDGHTTSQLALEMLREVVPHISAVQVLDMGCGSGVLGLAAASLLGCHVTAVDSNADAIALARRNARSNAMEHRFTFLHAEGMQPRVRDEGPFDLILANILAEPILGMSAAFAQALSEGGYIILSGIQRWQAEEVKEAFAVLGITATAEFQHEEWCCLLLCNAEEPDA